MKVIKMMMIITLLVSSDEDSEHSTARLVGPGIRHTLITSH